VAARGGREDPKGGVDWAEIYWRIQLNYPHEKRFNSANFGNTPIAIINQALSAIEDWELGRNAYLSQAIAISTATNLQLQGGKDVKLELFDPIARLTRKKRARKDISLRAARTFLGLAAQGKVPTWAFSLLDIEAIELAAD
jgi:hypothetical protein